MRSLCLLVILSVCLCITQSTAQSLRINGGVNFIPVFYDVSGGFYAGIASDLKKKKSFTFQPGLQYSYSNYTFSRNGSLPRYSVHSIQMPLSFRFDIGKKAGVGFGPQVSVNVRAKGKLNNEPARAVTSSLPIIGISGFIAPYFRVNPRTTIEARALLDPEVFNPAQWEWQYILIQMGVSWSIAKPVTE